MTDLGPYWDLKILIEDAAHARGQIAQDMGLDSPCWSAMNRAVQELQEARRLYNAP